MKKKLVVIGAAALCMALLAGCKSEEQIAQNSPPQSTVISPDVHITQDASERDTLTVNGEGEVRLTPDLASVSILINTTEQEAAEAQRINAELTEAVLASLKANGIQDADIKTESVSLSEVLNYKISPAELTGYSMRNVLSVTVREIDSVGKVNSDAIAAGATGTSNLAFTVSDSTGAYQDALKAAVAQAQGKAGAMAEALGVELSPIPASVNEVSSSYQPYLYDNTFVEEAPEATSSPSANDVPVSTGELTITAKVNVVYEIISAYSDASESEPEA